MDIRLEGRGEVDGGRVVDWDVGDGSGYGEFLVMWIKGREWNKLKYN